MPIGALAKKIFTTDERLPVAVTKASWIAALEAKDKEERDAAQRLIDWYNRDRTEIIAHLKEQGKTSFDSMDDWQFPIINAVPRTIRRLSMAYRHPPTREIIRDGEPLDPNKSSEKKELEGVETMLSGVNFDRKMRSIDRWSTLLNTIHIEVVWRKEAIDWDIRLRPIVTVIEDPEDYLSFSKFAYAWEPMDPDTLQPRKGWVYWTDEDHVFLTQGGIAVGMSRDDGKNPYRDEAGAPVIPIVTVRKLDEIPDYWGRLGADLVDAIQTMNIQLGNMWETVSLQTSGWPLLTNVDVEPGAKLKTGAKSPLIAKGIMKDDYPPSVTFPKPDPDIEEVQAFLDWFIKANAGAYGMPPSAWSMDEKRLSGFAKFMDNIELLENREEEADIWEDVENELFDRTRIVWNTWRPGEKVAEDLELRTTFPPVKIPETPTETLTRWTMKIGAGGASWVDYYMTEEGLSEEDAVARVKEIAERRKIGAPAPTAALPPDDDEEEGS